MFDQISISKMAYDAMVDKIDKLEKRLELIRNNATKYVEDLRKTHEREIWGLVAELDRSKRVADDHVAVLREQHQQELAQLAETHESQMKHRYDEVISRLNRSFLNRYKQLTDQIRQLENDKTDLAAEVVMLQRELKERQETIDAMWHSALQTRRPPSSSGG